MELELNDVLEAYWVNPDNAPIVTVAIDDVNWQYAEPDVGIMSDYVDEWAETWYLGEHSWTNDVSLFVSEGLFAGGHVEGTPDEIQKTLEARVKEYIDEMEQG